MADKSGQSFELPKKSSLVAELFTTQEQRDGDKHEKVIVIPLAALDAFPNHPFQVNIDEAMQAMVDSVKAVGIQTPAVVRQKEDGRYELVSGHRRKKACELAGLASMPCIVREMGIDEAIIAMVDANLQRETILPSEKAKSYQMKLDALKRQGERTDLTCAPMEHKYAGQKSRDIIAQESGDSREQVRRFIRLNYLNNHILDLVDAGKIALRPAVEISYIPLETQQVILNAIERENSTPSHIQAVKMRNFAESGRLSEDVAVSILQEEKQNRGEQLKIPRAKINKFFSPGVSSSEIADTIVAALEYYQQRKG